MIAIGCRVAFGSVSIADTLLRARANGQYNRFYPEFIQDFPPPGGGGSD